MPISSSRPLKPLRVPRRWALNCLDQSRRSGANTTIFVTYKDRFNAYIKQIKTERDDLNHFRKHYLGEVI